MMMRLLRWFNSLQAHMIGFACGVILVITAVSVAVILFAAPPQRSPMTIYDISRVIRGLATARLALPDEFESREVASATPPATEVERRLSRILAAELNLPGDAVHFHLGNRSLNNLDFMERQVALYGADGRGSPIVFGTVVAAVRQPDGRWLLFERQSKSGYGNFGLLLRASPWLGFLVVIPFSMWFSTKIARPVRTFAVAASQVRGGKEFPVPVVGPTEIRVAANALNEMQARIRAFVRERTALVGAIAHDLRTPLNSLSFRVARASDDLRVPAEADIRQLEQLINSILQYVESDARVLSIETIDLTSLLQSIVDNHADFGIGISLEAEPVSIDGDLLLLRRLFNNLIDNAVKFAPQVSISLAATSTSAVVEIADNGPGMTPTDLESAFEPFFRGERSRSRATGGMGLGLSIARTAAEAHGGEVVLANQAGGGLLVTVTLPLRQRPETDIVTERRAAAAYPA